MDIRTMGIALLLLLIAAVALAIYSSGNSLPAQCSDPDVAAVYECSDNSVMAESRLLGGGYKIIKHDSTEISCPVIANPSDECVYYLETCAKENKIC